jgi:hypothetical protein
VRSGAARMPTATWYLPERTGLYEPTSIMKALKRLAIEAGLRSLPQHDSAPRHGQVLSRGRGSGDVTMNDRSPPICYYAFQQLVTGLIVATSRVPPTNVLLLTLTLHDLSTEASVPLVSGTLLPVMVNRSTFSALNATVD